MKIAIWHNLPSGGGKRALYHHVRGLVARGHEVSAWCPPTADQSYLPLNALIQEVVVPLDLSPSQHPRLLSRFLYAYWQRTDLIRSLHKHARCCAEQINQGGFDLVYVHACQFLHSPGIGHYLTGPKLLYLQEPYRPLYEARPQLPWLALPPESFSYQSVRRFGQNLVDVQALRVQAREELANAQAFDRILVNSLFSRESLLRAYALESQVCYLGVDTELFRPQYRPRQNLVVGLGTLYKGKGVDRAIRAIATLDPAIRPTLLWIGNSRDPAFAQEMEQLAAALGVKFEIRILIPDSELVEWLNQAAVMIYPPVLEPFGFAPLEANACETPVVAIAEGGVRETIQDGVNGFLVPDADPVVLGQALARVLTNEPLRLQLGQQGRQFVLDHWSWDRAMDRLEQLLTQVVIAGSRP